MFVLGFLYLCWAIIVQFGFFIGPLYFNLVGCDFGPIVSIGVTIISIGLVSYFLISFTISTSNSEFFGVKFTGKHYST